MQIIIENLKSEAPSLRDVISKSKEYFDADDMKDKVDEDFDLKMMKESCCDMKESKGSSNSNNILVTDSAEYLLCHLHG